MSDLLFKPPPGEKPAPPPARFVRVVVERGLDDATGTDGLTYGSLDPAIAVGERVQVPLGKSQRVTGGIVVAVGGPELAAGFDLARIKLVTGRSGSALAPPLVELARWMARYYAAPLGMVLASMMPAAVKKSVGRRLEIRLSRAPADHPAAADLTPAARRAWATLVALPDAIFPIASTDLAAHLSDVGGSRAVKKLLTLGLLTSETADVVRTRGSGTLHAAPSHRSAEVTPTPDQARVIEGIGAQLSSESFGVHLLRGITGSGKTEVYIRLIRRALDAGHGAIVLVPEIALTPQAEEWFRARLADVNVAVLHSGLSASHRHAQWTKVASGESRVVIGPRSAIFAPMHDLGLIIVDEEHEGSYKHEQLPRYHARDVAVKRAQIHGCSVVLGSATPSLESWANAAAGRFTLWELTSRAGPGKLPDVTVVDMVQERRRLFDGPRPDPAPGQAPAIKFQDRQIGPTLEHALHQTLTDGGQAILLLNRRGYASYIACASHTCGWMLECDECDARLVFHKDRRLPKGGHVKCHHCLAEQILPRLCPLCSGPIVTLGTGTQRVEEELVALFGPHHGLAEGSSLLRVDGDTMSRSSDYFNALARFGTGEIRVLIGTQMIAKGLDFPNVRLVGVINADTALNLPDFRASERTFQLICQVAGRAGRGSLPGRVIVQSFQADNPAITLAAAHDYTTFAAHELVGRQQSGLPPATRMARIVCRDLDAQKCQARARDIAARLQAFPAIHTLGPAEAPISRIAGYYRWSIELFAASASAIQEALASLRTTDLLKSDSRTAIDVDPVSLM